MRRPGPVALASSLAVLVVVADGERCGLGQTSPSAAASPSQPPPPGAHKGTWVWEEATVLAADTRRDLLAFARAKGIDTLFVHAAPAYDQDRGFEALAQLVAEASRQGIAMVLVAGDPSWSLPAHRADALAFLERARRLRARLGARGLPSSDRVLFDVEPYMLPEWRTARETTIASYVALLRALQAAGRASSIEVWQTIPFWFPQHRTGGKPLDQMVLESSAGVVVMAYRNRADDVRTLAVPLLEQAARRGKPVIVAIETMCIEPSQVTFCGQTSGQLTAALAQIADALRPSPAFAGLAVHSYASWVKLAGRSR